MVGLKGDITVYSFFSKPTDIIRHRKFFLQNDQIINVRFKLNSNKILAKILGSSNPEGLKKIVGKLFYLEKSELPTLEHNQFYYNDLVNLNVFVKKKKIGFVISVKNHGAGDYLEISNDKDNLLVPFNNDHILEVELEYNRILLNHVYYEI